jgi:hypothetical protein
MTPRTGPPRELSGIQEVLWAGRRDHGVLGATARGLRLTGSVHEATLMSAIGEVAAAIEILRAGFAADAGAPAMIPDGPVPAVRAARVAGSPGERDQRSIEILSADRDTVPDLAKDPLVRFHVIRTAPDETVLGLVADPLVLDLRSVYLVLGAVMQAYFGRFRPAEYPPFAPIAHETPAGRAAASAARLAWWAKRLVAWEREPGPDGPGAAGPAAAPGERYATLELHLAAARWARLSEVAGDAGNSGSAAVIALLVWWLVARGSRARPSVFASTLDLREYRGLGPVIGPLTDRVVFQVDLDGYARMTFRDLVRRAHAGVLDAVIHYVPYRDLVTGGAADGQFRPAGPARLWDIAVHYCRLPPASTHTRGEPTLAGRGLSIELFRESALARAGLAMPAGTGDGTCADVHIAESGTGMALVVNFDAHAWPATEVASMLRGIDEMVSTVITDPATFLSRM